MELLIVLGCFALLSIMINAVARRFILPADRGLYWSINLGLVPFFSAAYGAWQLLSPNMSGTECPPPNGREFAFDCGIIDNRIGAFLGAYAFILIVPLAFAVVAIPVTLIMERRRGADK